MDWYKVIMVGMGLFCAVCLPGEFVRVVRRRQWHRLFDLPVCAAVIGYMVVEALAPSAVRHAPPLVHWLARGLFALLVVSVTGLSRRLFGPRKRPGPVGGAA